VFGIRIRIFLLAIVIFGAISTAFYLQYDFMHKKLLVTEEAMQSTNDISTITKLIHNLQKERGLTAGHLLEHKKKHHSSLIEQRAITESSLSKFYTNKNLLNDKSFINFQKHLYAKRKSIDSDSIDWDEAEAFYTSSINKLLKMLIIKIASLEYSQDISYELQSIFYLANARENLGLIRATLYRGYKRDNPTKKELLFVNYLYNSFTNNISIFEAISNTHFDKTQDSAWFIKIRNNAFNALLVNINATLYSAERELSDADLWWENTSLVIDNLKNIEDSIFKQIKRHVTNKIMEYNSYIFWYAGFALVVLLAVFLLTTFILVRIFKALSILINSLEKISDTYDLSLNIDKKTENEFTKNSQSITDLLKYTDKLIKEKELLATTDALTHLMNRRSFIAASKKEISRSNRYSTSCSLIYCDIDFFKLVNDKHGHAAGDIVLEAFAKSIKKNLRSNDLIGRWGGEEFIIFAPQTDLISAEKLAQKLRKEIMQLSFKDVGQLTCSFGVAQKNKNESFDELCERADKALYEAKNTGRNKVCVSE
jgi:diguanylate cyclase (GGDEF)-like protein